MEITLPFLDRPAGLGDAVKAVTSAVGIKPCEPCKKRAQKLNRMVTFVPARESEWTKPPEVPEGWTLKDSAGDRQFFERTGGGFIIWQVIEGEYRNSHSFCCESLRNQALAKWEELCRP
jgi:hypothetical protein